MLIENKFPHMETKNQSRSEGALIWALQRRERHKFPHTGTGIGGKNYGNKFSTG